MIIKEVVIKEKAILIADVHYKKGDKEFLNLLKNWLNYPPSQIFFLGDIFHLLLPFKYLIEYNKEAIDIINKLSKKTEIYYVYGNHDFKIDSIFPRIIFAEAFVDKEKSIFLTHGDLTEKDFFYKIYAKIIRNVFFMLHFLSFNFINNWVLKKILQKRIKCDKIRMYKKIKTKLTDIEYNNIIEGHYHQNLFCEIKNKIYVNLGSFFCEKVYFIYEDYLIKEKHDGRENIKGRLKRT